LRDDVARTIRLAEEALVDSQKVAEDRIRNPLDPLRYQRQLLENLRLLESIDQELASAQVDLASLINAPLGQPIRLAEMDLKNISDEIARVPVAHLEETALMRNADLLEQHYNSRIARTETRRALLRLFPNLSFNYALKYDSDTYQLHRNWNEAGAQLSFNLMGLFSGPAQIRLAEAGVALADQRRVATQLGVLTQVHLSRLQVINARSQFDRADAIYSTDKKIADLMRNRQAAQAQSKLDMVSAETAAILSLLRRYQALAQVQVAENRLIATLGLEPAIGNTQELPLKELVMQLGKSPAPWSALMNRPEAAAPGGRDPEPGIHLGRHLGWQPAFRARHRRERVPLHHRRLQGERRYGLQRQRLHLDGQRDGGQYRSGGQCGQRRPVGLCGGIWRRRGR
jgi:outer membrane protein TolC